MVLIFTFTSWQEIKKDHLPKILNYSRKCSREGDIGHRVNTKGSGGKTEKVWLGQAELTALHLVAHIATVVPAVTVQVFCDADARVAGELIGASCMKTRETRDGAEK